MYKLVNLKDNDDILIPKVVPFIDFNNQLYYTASTVLDYTATEDCILIITGIDDRYPLYIDEIPVSTNFALNSLLGGKWYFIKKGSHMQCNYIYFVVYGIKY